mgnify:CR=1 FL=1
MPVGGTSKLSQRESMELAAKAKKIPPEQLFKLPPVMPEMIYLLKWFFELKRDGPLQHSEIQAWSNLNFVELTKRELTTIMRLDVCHSSVRYG